MTFPDDKAIAEWIAKNPDRVTKCQPAIAYGIALDVVVPPDPDADKRMSDAFRKGKWGWQRKPAPRSPAQDAKNGRARSLQNHQRKQKADGDAGSKA